MAIEYVWLDEAGRELAQLSPHQLKVPEPVIIQKSIEFFDDPEPCMIHRSAVLSRLLMELEQALPMGVACPVDQLPEPFRGYLELEGRFCALIKREQPQPERKGRLFRFGKK